MSKDDSGEKTKPRAFTVRQQRFIDAYDGNATEAARKAK